MQSNFQDGPLYAGFGVYGNGTYVVRVSADTGAQQVAAHFAGDDGQVLRMSIKADARIANYDDLVAEIAKNPVTGEFREIIYDTGRYAAMQGYDAVRIVGLSNGVNKDEQYIILNRTAVRVSKTIRSGSEILEWRS